MQWERYIAAVIGLIEHFGVRLTIGLNAIPMAVPHTRPVGITSHASRQELIPDNEPWVQRVQVPASAGHLLEFRLTERGLDAIGFAAHIPHYLAQTEFPDAAERLVGAIALAGGLVLPTDELHVAGTAAKLEIDKQVADSTGGDGAGRCARTAIRRLPARPRQRPAGYRIRRPAVGRRTRRRARAVLGRPHQAPARRPRDLGRARTRTACRDAFGRPCHEDVFGVAQVRHRADLLARRVVDADLRTDVAFRVERQHRDVRVSCIS